MNPLLWPVATDFLFNRNDILSFIFSLKPLLPLEGEQYLKKSYFCQWKPFSLIFSDTDSNGSSLLVHLNRIFQLILHSGQWKRFLVNYKPFAFIQSFFLLVDTIFEIKCRPIPLAEKQLRSKNTKQKIRFEQPDEGFVEKCVYTIRKSCFHFKKPLNL